MEKYKVGEVLVSKDNQTLYKGLSNTPVVIPQGNKVIIGADRLAHHLRDNMIQPLNREAEISGIVSNGIVDMIYKYLAINLPLSEMLADYEITPKEFQGCMYEALEEIGIYKDEDTEAKQQ